MKKIVTLVTLLCWFASCEKIYVPDIDAQISSLVFEGLITDQPVEHFVRITKSVGFNNVSRFEKVSGYNVQIQDKNGTLIQLHAKGAGNYVTYRNVKGEINHEYRMVATDPLGRVYASEYEPLLASASIDTIKASYYQQKWLEKVDGYGFVEQTIKGVQLFTNASTIGYTPFYRYDYDGVFQSTQTYPTSPFSTICYIARPFNTLTKGLVAVTNANNYTNKVVIDFPVDYVNEDRMNSKIVLDSIESDSAGKPIYKSDQITFYQFGFLLRMKQYSLSEQGFNFWKAINDQVNGSGQLFDPVEAQILGNVTCEADSLENVFGYFGASAVTHKEQYFFLKWNDQVITKPVIYFPELTKNRSSYERFDFWVD